MKRTSCFFFVLLFSIFLVGCHGKERPTVVWMSDDAYLDASFERKFNKRLKELGCESQVDFQGFEFTEDDDYFDYINNGALPDYSGADIVTLPGEFEYTSYYFDLAKNGELYDLTDYLTGEEGKELYDSMPEEVWQGMEVDGHIYGILNPGCDYNCYIALNQADIDRYSLDVHEGLTMEELIQMAYIVHSEEPDRGFLVETRQAYLPQAYPLRNDFSEIGIYQQDGEWKVSLLIDLEEYQEHLKTLNQLYLDGILVPTSEAGKDFFAMPIGGYSEEVIRGKMREWYGGDWTVVACPEWNEPFCAGGIWKVILDASEKKEMAWEILLLAYTDRELSELLAYGATFKEGADRVNAKENRSSHYGNRFLIRPEVSAPEDYSERIVDVIRNSEKKEWLGFWLDTREFREDWKEIIRIQREHEDFYRGLSEDMEAEEAAIRAELEKAGIDAILEELNRQATEFQQGK